MKFGAKVLNERESQYGPGVLEIYAGKYAFIKERYMLLPKRDTIWYTDGKYIEQLWAGRKNSSPMKRWQLILQEYGFIVNMLKARKISYQIIYLDFLIH